MKEILIKKYQCETCYMQYATAEEALRCEEKLVSQNRGLKIGDMVRVLNGQVRVLNGQGRGEIAKVSGISIIDMNWGHYSAARYHHTVALEADLHDGGTRFLTFDDYEPL